MVFVGFFWVLLGFQWVLPGLTRFDFILLGFTGFSWILFGLIGFHSGFDGIWFEFTSCNEFFIGFFYVLCDISRFIRFYCISLCFTEFHWVSLDIIRFFLLDRIELDVVRWNEFQWIFTEFWLEFIGFYRILPDVIRFHWFLMQFYRVAVFFRFCIALFVTPLLRRVPFFFIFIAFRRIHHGASSA